MSDSREREQTSRALIVRLRDKAFNYSADPILEEAASEIERLLALMPLPVRDGWVPDVCPNNVAQDPFCRCGDCSTARAGIDSRWP